VLQYTVSRASAEKFSGRGATEKKTENSSIKPLPKEGDGNEDRKNSKKERKIALLSLYLLSVSVM